MKSLILVLAMIFAMRSFSSESSEGVSNERGEWSTRPYRCRFTPSPDIRHAIAFWEDWESTKKPYMERWSVHKENAVATIESECVRAVEYYEHGDPQSCYNYQESQMYCKKKWRLFYEW